MLIALKKAFFDVFKSNIRGLLWATVFITVLLFGLLFFGFSELARYWQIKDMPSVSIIINAVGVLAFFVLALFLFPAVATFVAGFFMDTAVERKPNTKPCRSERFRCPKALKCPESQ